MIPACTLTNRADPIDLLPELHKSIAGIACVVEYVGLPVSAPDQARMLGLLRMKSHTAPDTFPTH